MKIVKMEKRFFDLLPQDKQICLLGLQGSRGLGLQQTADADYDYRGVWLAKNQDLVGLTQFVPKSTIEYNDHRDDEMDYVLHEVGKFFELCLKGNPSVVTLLFLPKYNICDSVGSEIVANRNLFLSSTAVRKAFGGYAMAQVLYLKRKHKFPDGRKQEKHIRHIFRLFDMGQELLETGQMTMPLADPQKYLDLQTMTIEQTYEMFEKRDREFQTAKSILPEQPETYLVNKLLLKIRGLN